jgi:ribonuclease R
LTRRPGQPPGKAEIKRFIEESQGPVGRREIARAFGIKGAARADLRAVLKELADEGVIGRGRRRRYAPAGALPAVAVLRISEVDEDGVLYAAPVRADADDAPPPRIVLAAEDRAGPALGIGDRVLARLQRVDDGYQASVIRRLPHEVTRLIGVYTEIQGGGRILPTDRRQKYDFLVEKGDSGGARKGELVAAEILPARRLGLRAARVVERLGAMTDRRAISLIAIHGHDIPDHFPAEVVALAKAAKPAGPAGRVDLRHLPLITVDGADARDFDDAIWAGADEAPDNPGGWHIAVAIADVAHYVRAGDALDREARLRGNSVYFPDRVVPMLPDALSSGLCSLLPGEDRPVLVVSMRLDANGRRLDQRFERALMRSAGRVIYEDMQAARDGRVNDTTAGLLDDVIMPLYGAWEALMRARAERGPLDLDIPEMQISLDDDGRIADVRSRARLDAHRVIEEFMIEANVAAAETLERRKMACLYRVHDEPDREKLRGLRDFLRGLGLSLSLGEVMRPVLFNRILAKAQETPNWEAVNQTILRAQAQARYDPDNIGHFGLALRRYAHFTSPIRRYADLLVHRALIRALGLGDGGLDDDEIDRLPEIADHISNTERRAMAAERDANDRYIAAFMAEQVGASFQATINGVTRAGLFVTLAETGADGLLPMSNLGDDYFALDEAGMSLQGRHGGKRYRLGDRLEVRLAEVNTLTGGLIFELQAAGGDETSPRRPRMKRGKRRAAKKRAGKKG